MTKQEAIEEAAKKIIPNRIIKTAFGTPQEITPTRERNAFIKGANWYKENESKNPIDLNKLREEFFAECTHEKYNQDAQWDERFQKIVSLAPHDLFEWFKKKLTTKL